MVNLNSNDVENINYYQVANRNLFLVYVRKQLVWHMATVLLPCFSMFVLTRLLVLDGPLSQNVCAEESWYVGQNTWESWGTQTNMKTTKQYPSLHVKYKTQSDFSSYPMGHDESSHIASRGGAATAWSSSVASEVGLCSILCKVVCQMVTASSIRLLAYLYSFISTNTVYQKWLLWSPKQYAYWILSQQIFWRLFSLYWLRQYLKLQVTYS